MTNLTDSLQSILTAMPEKAWAPIGTIIAATIAVLGVGLSLWWQAAIGRRQREFELRRTELFKLMEDAALGLQVFNEAGTWERPLSELSRIRTPLMASHTRAMCFADYETVRQSYDLEIAFAKGWHPVAQTLNYHQLLNRLVKDAMGRWDGEVDPDKKLALQEAVDGWEKLRQRTHIRLLERVTIAAENYVKCWTELEIVVRAEIHRANSGGLGKRFSPDEYRMMVQSANRELEELNQGSKEWNKKFFALLNSKPLTRTLIEDFDRNE